MIKKALFLQFALFMLLLCGCAVENNFLRPDEFADRLRRDGMNVESVREVSPQPFRANSGYAIKISGSEIGVYKYDSTSKIQKKRLERVVKDGCLYINGLPYPVVVYGSFVFMGLEKNPEKYAIIESIKKFK
jgi:hypothetical protein